MQWWQDTRSALDQASVPVEAASATDSCTQPRQIARIRKIVILNMPQVLLIPVPREWSVLLRPWDRREAASCSPPRPAPASGSDLAESSARNDVPQRRRALRKGVPSPTWRRRGESWRAYWSTAAESGAGERVAVVAAAQQLHARGAAHGQSALRPEPVATPVTDCKAGTAHGGGGRACVGFGGCQQRGSGAAGAAAGGGAAVAWAAAVRGRLRGDAPDSPGARRAAAAHPQGEAPHTAA